MEPMKHTTNKLYLSVFLSVLSALVAFNQSCSNTDASQKEPEEISRRTFEEDMPEVDTTHAKMATFYQELISNGKLEASQSAELKFRFNAQIEEVRVKNGKRVRKGDTLAILENFEQKIKIEQAEQNLEKARLELKDVLIGQGYYVFKDSTNVPPDIQRMAENKSGYLQAQSELKLAQRNYEHAFVLAPFSGIISELEAQAFNNADTYESFCTLLNDHTFEVVFEVLEPELARIQLGQKVEVQALAMESKTYRGNISEINPLVNKEGMIQVKARVNNTSGKLLAGMNVRITLRKALPKQLIVPKKAVVLRQGREVIFTCVRDTALWNYVKIGEENSREYTIEEGIEAGDVIIVGGNLNLAHKVRVKSH